MKILYLDCQMGIAGDMLTSALLELLPEPDSFLDRLNALHIPHVTFDPIKSTKCGIVGTHMIVKVDGVEEHSHDFHKGETSLSSHHDNEDTHEHHTHHHDHEHSHEHHHHEHDHHSEIHEHSHDHHHSTLQDISDIVGAFDISDKVKKDIMNVYEILARAEGKVHGKDMTEIHFHEVGTMDAIADITAVCMLMDELSPDTVISSPIHVGYGQVHCMHGILPVPAPATAEILKGIPTYSGDVRGELCTPTGAALIKYFVDRFGSQPPMRVLSIGYGLGTKDFPMANVVRASLGENDEKPTYVVELNCNIDDMNPELIGSTIEVLMEAGALDVYTCPINMKKNRPGTLLRCLCREDMKEKMVSLIFHNTTTIGIREIRYSRYVLDREIEVVHTPYGDVRRKTVSGYGVNRSKWEYDDLEKISREYDMSILELTEKLKALS